MSQRQMVFRDVSLDVSLDSFLRCAVLFGPDGGAEEFVLALGRGQGRQWKELPAEGGLDLPVEVLPALVRALLSLEASADALKER